jgi:alanine racemase
MTDHNARVWIEINRAALIHNIIQLKKVLNTLHVAAVIKCNAYGHGLISVGRICDDQPEVYMLCVAFLSEALQLRKSGVTKHILVMCYIDDDLAKAVNEDIAFMVDTYEEIYAMNAVGAQHSYRFSIHIKVDTGLSRRGISSEEVYRFIITSQQLPYVHVVGLCSHFACAYLAESLQTTVQQRLFSTIIQSLAMTGNLPPLVHISNSSLISVEGCSMVRVGLALYGYNASSYSLDLRPVLRLKSIVHAIRTVPENRSIGYDALCITTRVTRVGLIPIGYADGYDMRFSNCCVVELHNQQVPVLGRVGMNCIAVDLTEISDVHVGTEVTLIGDTPGVRMSDLLHAAGMRNVREPLTRLNPLIPRYVV